MLLFLYQLPIFFFQDCFGDRSVQKVVSVTSCMLTAIQAMPFGEQIRTFTWRAQKTPLKASDALLHQEIIMSKKDKIVVVYRDFFFLNFILIYLFIFFFTFNLVVKYNASKRLDDLI